MTSTTPCSCERAAGAFILRIAVGLLFVMAAVNKFIAGPGAVAEGIQGMFAESWLPGFMLVPYTLVLPWAELVLGVLILAGLFRFWSLSLGGLLMVSLVFGQLVIGNNDKVASIMPYVAMFAAALFTTPWDKFALDTLLARKRPATPPE